MPESIFFAGLALAGATAVALWILHPLLAPKPPIDTRRKKAKEFASWLSIAMFIPLAARAITGNWEVDRLIAAILLPGIAYCVGFGIGWLIKSDPNSVTNVSSTTLSQTPFGEKATAAQQIAPTSVGIANMETGVISKIDEEEIWAKAFAECTGPSRRPGLWAKALAASEGDVGRAEAFYLKERYSELSEAFLAGKAK